MARPESIANLTTGITSASNLILVSPQTNIGYYQQPSPVPAGIDETSLAQPGFLFDYEGENVVMLESDITDHYVENNSTISDQIAIKPVVINVQGFVGELNDILPALQELVKGLQSKLQVLSPYTPELSATALVAINEAILAYQVVANTADSVQQTLTSIFSGNYKNKQQLAFANFYQAYQARTLFTVQTPWNIFGNMAIKSLRAVQNAETRMISDFEISFKQINFVSTKTITDSVSQERASAQYSDQVNLGTNNTNSSGKALSSIYGNLGRNA